MQTFVRAAIVGIALSIAGPASAVDMCFSATPVLFVAKSYKRPPIGKCRSIAGYEASTAIPHPATGTACLNASGTRLYVHWEMLQVTGGEEELYSLRMDMPFPSMTGGFSSHVSVKLAGNSFGGAGAIAYPCNPAPLP